MHAHPGRARHPRQDHRHLPLLRRRTFRPRLHASGHAPLGLLRFEADGTDGTTEPRPGEIIATSNADFASVAVARAALASAGAALAADIPRYINIRPVLHVSDVLVHER
jgi:hypothetical protein